MHKHNPLFQRSLLVAACIPASALALEAVSSGNMQASMTISR